MRKILLVMAKPSQEELYLTTLQPLGMLGIASFLESKGVHVDVIDQNVTNFSLQDVQDYDVIGFSLNSANIKGVFSLGRDIKEQYPDKKIVIGGPHVKCVAKDLTVNTFIDVVIIGEAEEVFYKYLTAKNSFLVKGLYLKSKKGIIHTGNPEPIKNLDKLPFPAITKVPYEKYDTVIKKRKPVCGIITSRGCPYDCVFCLHALGKRWRPRSAGNVVEELEWHVNNLGVKEVWIADDNFTLDQKRVHDICKLIKKKNLSFVFSLTNGVRTEKLDKETLEMLYGAGCWLICVAPESGDADTLKKIKKRLDLDKVKEVVELCRRIGIVTKSNFIIGFPWEHAENMENTIRFAQELDTDFVQFSKPSIYPTTGLYKMCPPKGLDPFREEAQFSSSKELNYEHANFTYQELARLTRKAYRSTILKPCKLFKVFKILGLRGSLSMAKYAKNTKNV